MVGGNGDSGIHFETNMIMILYYTGLRMGLLLWCSGIMCCPKTASRICFLRLFFFRPSKSELNTIMGI